MLCVMQCSVSWLTMCKHVNANYVKVVGHLIINCDSKWAEILHISTLPSWIMVYGYMTTLVVIKFIRIWLFHLEILAIYTIFDRHCYTVTKKIKSDYMDMIVHLEILAIYTIFDGHCYTVTIKSVYQWKLIDFSQFYNFFWNLPTEY